MQTAEPPFYLTYVKLVPESDVLAALEGQLANELESLRSISESQAGQVHPPYKWTLKEVIGHMIDTEIVFFYRAFRFSRRDATPLAGFDQDDYIANGNYNQRNVSDIVEQLLAVRRANIAAFRAMPSPAWNHTGTASNLQWSVTDLAKAMVGHVRHHQRILDARLNQPSTTNL
jgi:hypothetical protein